MKSKTLLAFILLGTVSSLPGLADEGKRCAQQVASAIPSSLIVQHNDFSTEPVSPDTYTIAIRVSNESQFKLFFAHDINSKRSRDFKVFSFEPGCSESVTFKEVSGVFRGLYVEAAKLDGHFKGSEDGCENPVAGGECYWKGIRYDVTTIGKAKTDKDDKAIRRYIIDGSLAAVSSIKYSYEAESRIYFVDIKLTDQQQTNDSWLNL